MRNIRHFSPIAFLEQYGQLGGGQQVLLELVQAAKSLGHRVTVLVPAGPIVEKLHELGVNVRLIPQCKLQRGKKSISDVFLLGWYTLRLLLSHGFFLIQQQLLYVNGNRLLPIAFVLSVLFNKKTVYHVHLHYEGMERNLLLLVLRSRYTMALIVPSFFILRELLAFSTVFNDPRVQVVENGLDSRFGFCDFDDRFTGRMLQRIAIVGRISPEKGQDVVIILAKKFPHMIFHLLGDAAFSDADYLGILQQTAPSNVVFHGWVDDLPQKVRELEIQLCLVPSRGNFEAAPLVPLQMAALSCRVAVRNAGALADVAEKMQFDTFVSDAAIVPYLAQLEKETSEINLKKTAEIFERVQAHYGHETWQKQLCTFFESLN